MKRSASVPVEISTVWSVFQYQMRSPRWIAARAGVKDGPSPFIDSNRYVGAVTMTRYPPSTTFGSSFGSQMYIWNLRATPPRSRLRRAVSFVIAYGEGSMLSRSLWSESASTPESHRHQRVDPSRGGFSSTAQKRCVERLRTSMCYRSTERARLEFRAMYRRSRDTEPVGSGVGSQRKRPSASTGVAVCHFNCDTARGGLVFQFVTGEPEGEMTVGDSRGHETVGSTAVANRGDV